MRVLKVITILFYFIYFLLILLGNPEQLTRTLEETGTEIRNKKSHTQNFFWKTGLLNKTWLQYQAASSFEEQLLEGDTKPSEIFRSLNRSIVQNIFFLGLTIFWLCLVAFYLIASSSKYKFLESLSGYILLLSFIVIILKLTFPETTKFSNHATSYDIKDKIETPLITWLEISLVFLSIVNLVYHIFYKITRLIKEKKGLRPKTKKLSSKENLHAAKLNINWQAIPPIVLHFLLICLASILLANLILLPIYALQLSFPQIFAFFLFFIMFLALLYYSHAYWHLLSDEKARAQFSVALAYLAFRLFRNAIFLTFVIIIVALIMGSIILISSYNVGLLKNFEY